MKSAVEIAMGRCCCQRLTDSQKHRIAVLNAETDSKLNEVRVELKERIRKLEAEGDFENALKLSNELFLRGKELKAERDQLIEMVRSDPNRPAIPVG